MREELDKFQPDYSKFNERTTQHLKRPALVTIKKPLLQPAEMEDVLTRLLQKEVPPVIPADNRTFGAGSIRAIIIGRGKAGANYTIRDLIQDGVSPTVDTYLNSYGIVRTTQNIVVHENKTHEDSKAQYVAENKASKDQTGVASPVVLKQEKQANEDIFFGMDSAVWNDLSEVTGTKFIRRPSRVSLFPTRDPLLVNVLTPQPIIKSKNFQKTRLLSSPIAQKTNRMQDAMLAYDISYDTITSLNPEVQELLRKNRVDLYLFYESDAQSLIFGSDKESQDKFEASAKRKPWGRNVVIPTDAHSQKIFYDNTSEVSDSEGVKIAKNGSIFRPKYVETLVITSDSDELVNNINEKNEKIKIKTNLSKPGEEPTRYEIQRLLKLHVWGPDNCKKRKYKAVLHHFVCLIKPQHTWQVTSNGIGGNSVFKTQGEVVAFYREALEKACKKLKRISTKSAQEKAKIIFKIKETNSPDLIIATAKQVISKQKTLDDLKHLIEGLIQDCNTYNEEYKKFHGINGNSTKYYYGPGYNFNDPYLVDIVSEEDRLKKVLNDMLTDYKDGFEVKTNITRLPMLPTDLNTSALLAKAKQMEEAQLYTLSNLTTKEAAHSTFGSFTVKYYSVLLKKIEAKYNNLKEFFDKDLLRFPYYNEFKAASDLLRDKTFTLKNTSYNFDSVNFLSAMEVLLFGPHSGFYITSKSNEEHPPTAPLINAEATSPDDFVKTKQDPFTTLSNVKNLTTVLDEFATQEMENVALRRLLTTKNDDVMSINVNRSTASSSESTCVIQLKNYDHKYNYTSSQLYSYLNKLTPKTGVETADKSDNIFDPLDTVTVYLPNKEGKLNIVYTGIISKIQAENQGGYNHITLNCTCQKRLLNLSRTNTMPSFSREESFNSQVVAFTVLPVFLKNITLWMPYIAVPALSYMMCQPKRITEKEFNKKLFELEEQPILRFLSGEEVSKQAEDREVKVQKEEKSALNKKDVVVQKVKDVTLKDAFVSQIKSSSNIAGILENKNINLNAGAQLIDTGTEVEQPYTYEELVKMSAADQDLDFSFVKSKVVYKQVKFFDPLYNYIWYKSNTNYSLTDSYIVGSALTELLNEYVDTLVVGSSDDPGLKVKAHGIYNVQKLLATGERGAYVVYKQRYDTKIFEKYVQTYKEDADLMCTFPREAVLKFVGTSQPIYQLQPGTPEIQFSAWKTNVEILKEVANKYDFIFYADRYGTLLFSPINMDLSSLATNHYTDTSLPNKILMETLPSHYLESLDSNYQILKKKDLKNYKRIEDERRILNWIPLSGQMGIGGNIGNMIHAQVQDPRLIRKLGVRSSKNVTVLGCPDQETLQYYGMCWMDRNNKRYLACDATGMFDSTMDINLPYYAHFDNTIYYAEAISIQYTPGQTCTYTLGGAFGRKPLLKIDVEDTEKAKTNLRTLYTNLQITPSVYAQYSVILDRATICNEILKKMDRYSQIKQKIKDLQNTIENLKDSITDLNGLVDVGVSKIRDLTADIVTKSQLINEWTETQNTLIAQIDSDTIALQEAIASSDVAEIERLEAELEVLNQNLKYVQDRLTLLGAEGRELVRERSVVQDQVTEARETIKDETAEVAEITRQIPEQEKEADDLLTQMSNQASKQGFGKITAQTKKQDVERLRNSLLAVICYNGYIWDNISGISFEELPYYASYILGANASKAWESALLGTGADKPVRALSLIQKLIDAQNTAADVQVRNIYSLYTKDLIALSNENLRKQKENILTKYYYQDDLLVSPLVHEDAAVEKGVNTKIKDA